MDDADLAQQHIALRQRKTDETIRQARAQAALLSEASHTAINARLRSVCIECGEEIPVDRLMKVPGSRRRIDCQQDIERAYR